MTPLGSQPFLAQAARARIDEQHARLSRRETMTTHDITELDVSDAPEESVWALGDYHAFARATVWEVGRDLVAACGIGPGQRVLDVAAGSGNVAIQAAAAGAIVVASDQTAANFAAGRREAAASGVELEWVQADAQALPFPDASFDVVASCFGVMFADDHEAAARELVRVCRPGGTVGLASFTPDGLGGDFFAVFGRHLPPPPDGALPPILWGSEEHVRALLEHRVRSLELTRASYVERSPGGPEDYCRLFTSTFGPAIALASSPVGDAFRADLLDYAVTANSAPPGTAAEYVYEYLQVIARV